MLIPGDMGRASYVLVGRPGAMSETIGSSCHGAGRRMSRTAAIKSARGRSIQKELLARGVIARARGRATVAGKPSDDLAPGTLGSILKQAGLAARP